MARIIVHGMEYEAPDSFTLKEMRVVERYTDGHMTGDGYEISKICATIHVAIMRAKPELPFEEIQAVVDDLPRGPGWHLSGRRHGRAEPPSRKQLREQRLFERRFRSIFGSRPGEREPRELWFPGLGWFSILPYDVGELTPRQLMACVDALKDGAKARS